MNRTEKARRTSAGYNRIVLFHKDTCTDNLALPADEPCIRSPGRHGLLQEGYLKRFDFSKDRNCKKYGSYGHFFRNHSA